MRKPLFYCLGLLTFLLAVSCGPEKSETAAPGPETGTPGASRPERVMARVTDDSLRVRVSPYLDAEIIGHLMTDNRVLIESRTSWNESIAGFNSPWFFIRADGYSGWVYGGFLDFGTCSFQDVPVDPGMVPPGRENKDEVEITGVGILDPGVLPEILLPVFGMENPLDVGKLTEGVIGYDESQEKLYIPFSELSEPSPLRDFRDGIKPGELLHVVAESESSSRYERFYRRDECEFLSGIEEGCSPDAVLVDFFRLAVLESGSWEIYAFPGDSNWPAAVGGIEIHPAALSFVSSPDPDPFRDSPRSRFSPGDTLYIFGNRESDPGHLQFGLYHESDEYREGQILLRPAAALELNTDAGGFWSAELLLDNSLPTGRYWGAVGNPITGAENLKLFITSILYGNIS